MRNVINKPPKPTRCAVKIYENGKHAGQLTIYATAEQVKVAIECALKSASNIRFCDGPNA